MAPRDPILGLNEQFGGDPNPNKVNLGVGVYYDENGKLPLLKCVMPPPSRRWPKPPSRAATCRSTASPPTTGRAGPGLRRRQRRGQGQTCGHRAGHRRHRRLKVGADFLKQVSPDGQVLISAPSWENHRALFTQRRLRRGRATRTTTPAKRGIDFDGMLAALRAAEGRHDRRAARLLPQPDRLRPDGSAQWDEVVAIVKARSLVPFLDMAYQGFGEGLPKTARRSGKFVASRHATSSSSTSFSKSFSLYGERVGALSWSSAPAPRSVARAVAAEDRHPHQLLQPADARRADRRHRAATPALRAQWEQELAGMRVRIKAMRTALVDRLAAAGVKQDMGFIAPPARHVQLLGLERAADAAPAQRVRHLRCRLGPHLRGRAECRRTSTPSSRPSPRSCKPDLSSRAPEKPRVLRVIRCFCAGGRSTG